MWGISFMPFQVLADHSYTLYLAVFAHGLEGYAPKILSGASNTSACLFRVIIIRGTFSGLVFLFLHHELVHIHLIFRLCNWTFD